MSFILDALKKSETDRQRQNGPALFEVKVAPPRGGLPLWAVALAILLGVNLVIVGWVLLRHPSQSPVEAAAAPSTNPGVAAGPATGTAATSTPQGGQQQGQAPFQGGGLPSTAPVAGTAPATPLAQTAGMTQPAPVAPPVAPPVALPGAPQAINAGPGGTAFQPTLAAGAPDPTVANPDDYAPAAEAGPTTPFGNRVSRGTESGLQLYQDAALVQGAHIPELRLDLHVFAAKPQDRFVMINMKKLHEGDSLPDGVRVENITPDGAVLSHNGAKFLLPRD